MVRMILATDMATHGAHVASLHRLYAASGVAPPAHASAYGHGLATVVL